MTSTAQQTAPPPAGAPAPTASPAPPSASDARIDRIEATQREQGAVLGRLEQLLTGGAGPHGQHAAGGPAQPQAGDIAAQVRQEIMDADQRRKAEESDATWRAGVTESIEKLRAERAPRDPAPGLRGRLQRLIVGKDPE
jgi:hypothetical protein